MESAMPSTLFFRLVAGLACVASLAAATPVFANNEFCDQELAPMMQERDAIQKAVMTIVEQSKKKPGDEGVRQQYCGVMGRLIGNAQKTLAYLEKNKEFCGVPDEFIANLKKGVAQQVSVRRKACVPGAARPAGPAGPALGGGGAGLRPPGNLRLQ